MASPHNPIRLMLTATFYSFIESLRYQTDPVAREELIGNFVEDILHSLDMPEALPSLPGKTLQMICERADIPTGSNPFHNALLSE